MYENGERVVSVRTRAGGQPWAYSGVIVERRARQQVLANGTVISKAFNGTHYNGTVQSYDAASGFYKIKYEDGDEEELDATEVSKHLVVLDNLGLAPRNWQASKAKVEKKAVVSLVAIPSASSWKGKQKNWKQWKRDHKFRNGAYGWAYYCADNKRGQCVRKTAGWYRVRIWSRPCATCFKERRWDCPRKKTKGKVDHTEDLKERLRDANGNPHSLHLIVW